jgi:hypothetical protein
MMRMMLPLLIDEEPDLKQTSQAVNHKEYTLPDEEVIKQDPDQKEEEAQVVETTRIEMVNSATFARSKGTGKKNVRKDSRRTSLAETHKDGPTSRRSTSWMRIQKRRQSTPSTTRMTDTRTMKERFTLPELNISQEPQPFPSNFWVFSKELDDSPHPSS